MQDNRAKKQVVQESDMMSGLSQRLSSTITISFSVLEQSWYDIGNESTAIIDQRW